MHRYQFYCGHCRQRLVADADITSQSITCPQCETCLIAPPCPSSQLGRAVGAAPLLLAAEPDEEPAVSFGELERAGDPEMDMTPMVDVTFLLLIFFMVTAAFTMQKSFEVPAPKPDEPSSQTRTMQDIEDDPNVVVVRIDEYNTFYVVAAAWDEEKEAPSKQELLVKLREARSSGSGGTVANTLLVMAHGDAMHGKVVTAMDAGSEVGMDEVKLATFEDDG